MSLKETLEKMKEEFQAQAPAEAQKTMKQSTEELIESGAMNKVIKTGEKAPVFILPDEKGNMVSSADLLKEGPLVITFYRGTW